MSRGDARNQGIERGQWLLFSALAGVGLLVFAIWIGAGGGNSAPPLRGIDAQLAVPGESEAGWVRLSRNPVRRHRSALAGHRVSQSPA